MNDQVTRKRGFADWFRELARKWRPAPIRLDLMPAATKRTPKRPASPEAPPGNYYFFELFLEITLCGLTHLGYPKQALLNTSTTPPVLRWGSPLKLSWPDPAIRRLRWIDDPVRGLSTRIITSPEDLLGVVGLFGDKQYRFEKILQALKNEVVYSLVCDENQTRIAYGFSRDLFNLEKAVAKTIN